MSITPTDKEGYNSFSEFPGISYNIISYLMDNNELIWRLIAYPNATAFRLDTTHPNLTKAQKGALIYDGIKDQTSCNVFLDISLDDAWTRETTILRITPIELIPTEKVLGNTSVAMQVFSHPKINTLANYQTRVDMIIQQLIQTLNGQQIGTIGPLYFNRKSSSLCRVSTIGSIPYHGKNIVMCTWTT